MPKNYKVQKAVFCLCAFYLNTCVNHWWQTSRQTQTCLCVLSNVRDVLWQAGWHVAVTQRQADVRWTNEIVIRLDRPVIWWSRAAAGRSDYRKSRDERSLGLVLGFHPHSLKLNFCCHYMVFIGDPQTGNIPEKEFKVIQIEKIFWCFMSQRNTAWVNHL